METPKDINYDQLPHKNILCIDMKSFYASIEAADRGLDPWEDCLAVVGDKNRDGGVVLAATPAIKEKYQIGTANRVYQIPESSDIKIVEARMGLYLDRSMEITRMFNQYVPLDSIHVYSVDESWLDLTGTEKLYGDKMKTAEEIKERLRKEYGLFCSMAIGPNMFMAKVAMDIEGKKKGLVEWTYDDVPDKLWPLPLKECWGIGSRLAQRLGKIGVKTVGDLAHLPLNYLEDKFGVMGNQLYYHAWGVDLSRVEGHYQDEPRSIGRGITLYRDYREKEEIKTVIFELSEVVARRARQQNVVGRTINLGVAYSREERTGGFNRQRTIEGYTNLVFDIYQTCLDLFSQFYNGERVRKVNVSLSNLASDQELQLNLFSDKDKEARLNYLKDQLQDKFDHKALFYGRSLKKGSIRERINTTIGGHKR
mgnify:FL=1